MRIHGRHRLSSVRDFDMIVVFESGRMVGIWTCDELLERDGLFSHGAGVDFHRGSGRVSHLGCVDISGEGAR